MLMTGSDVSIVRSNRALLPGVVGCTCLIMEKHMIEYINNGMRRMGIQYDATIFTDEDLMYLDKEKERYYFVSYRRLMP